MIEGIRTLLRPVNHNDASMLLQWENNPEFWAISGQPGPYTLEDILAFIESGQSLRSTGQARWIIEEKTMKYPAGAIDLFNFDANKETAGVGILIADERLRRSGLASDALCSMMAYAPINLQIRQLECLIYPDNIASIRLFEKFGFLATGTEPFNNRSAIRYRCPLS